MALQGSKLYVAMAGSHQIGVIDLLGGTIARFAGSGREDIRDGSPDEAAFAQPSGLSFSADRGTLFVADSESSGIRTIELETGQTHTLLGTGLFDWGDGEGALRPRLIPGTRSGSLLPAASACGLLTATTARSKLIDRENKLSTQGARSRLESGSPTRAASGWKATAPC